MSEIDKQLQAVAEIAEAVMARVAVVGLEAAEDVFHRMPWGQEIALSNGRVGTLEPFFKPRINEETERAEFGIDLRAKDGSWRLAFICKHTGGGGQAMTASMKPEALSVEAKVSHFRYWAEAARTEQFKSPMMGILLDEYANLLESQALAAQPGAGKDADQRGAAGSELPAGSSSPAESGAMPQPAQQQDLSAPHHSARSAEGVVPDPAPSPDWKRAIEAAAKVREDIGEHNEHSDAHDCAKAIRSLSPCEPGMPDDPAAFLEWMKRYCRIIYHPPGGEYPIEHSMRANKDSWDMLLAARPADGSKP